MIDVLVANTQPVALLGTLSALHGRTGIFAVETAHDGTEFIALASVGCFDVLLVECDLACALGAAAFERVRTLRPDARLLIYGDRPLPLPLADIVAFRAFGALTKSCSSAELRIAVSTVAAGRPYIDATLARLLRNDLFCPRRLEGRYLSPKELRIFKMLAIGMSDQQIAVQLGKQTRDVSHLTARVTGRIVGPEQADIVRYAASRGFL